MNPENTQFTKHHFILLINTQDEVQRMKYKGWSTKDEDNFVTNQILGNVNKVKNT